MTKRHLTELEISTAADGESLPDELGAHLEVCEACLHRLGDAAIERGDIHAALSDASVRVVTEPSRLPVAWILVAGSLGLVGAAGLSSDFERFFLRMLEAGRFLRQFGPLIARVVLASAGPLWAMFFLVSATAALFAWFVRRRTVRA